ncbi:MAG: hypothetical protein RR277_07745 [Rikenellaceae bacterium]
MSLFIQIVAILLVWACVSIHSKIKEANEENKEYQNNVERYKSILSKYNAPDPETATDDECLNFAEKHRKDDSFVTMTYYDYGRLIGYPIERKKRKKE